MEIKYASSAGGDIDMARTLSNFSVMEMETGVKVEEMNPSQNGVSVEMVAFLYKLGLVTKDPALRWVPTESEKELFVPLASKSTRRTGNNSRNPNYKSKEYVVEAVVGKKIDGHGKTLYKIKWMGYTSDDNTWEPEKNLPPAMIKKYEAKQSRKLQLLSQANFGEIDTDESNPKLPTTSQTDACLTDKNNATSTENRPKRQRVTRVIPGTVQKTNLHTTRSRATKRAVEPIGTGTEPENSWLPEHKLGSAEKKNIRKGYGNGVYVVEKILRKKLRSNGSPLYLIKWYGYKSKQNTWEPPENIAADMVQEFERENAATGKRTKNETRVSSEHKQKGSENTVPVEQETPPPKLFNQLLSNVKKRVAVMPKMPKIEDMETGVLMVGDSTPRKKSKFDRGHAKKNSSESDGALAVSPEPLAVQAKRAKRGVTKPKSSISGKRVHCAYDADLRGKCLRHIVGGTKLDGGLALLVTFKDTEDVKVVKSAEMRKYFPTQLIDFYESLLTFESDPE